MVRVAKVKLDFDFRPEDIIDEYRLALSRIEKKHNMEEQRIRRIVSNSLQKILKESKRR